MSNGNKLKKIQDEQQIFSALTSAKDNGYEIYVWRFVGGEKHLALSKIEAVRKQRNDFCIVPSDGQDRLVQELIGGQTQVDLRRVRHVVLERDGRVLHHGRIKAVADGAREGGLKF